MDVLITKTSNRIKTTVYKKLTFSELYTKWDSYTSTKYKTNLINNLLHRAHQICCSFASLRKQFKQISLVLEKNGCPKNLLNKYINRFLGNHYGKDSPKEHIFKNPRVKNVFMPLTFIREIYRSAVKIQYTPRYCNTPLRPVVSMAGNPEYKLAK